MKKDVYINSLFEIEILQGHLPVDLSLLVSCVLSSHSTTPSSLQREIRNKTPINFRVKGIALYTADLIKRIRD